MRQVSFPISSSTRTALFSPRERVPARIAEAQPATQRPLLGVSVCDLGWTDALSHVEMVCDHHLGPRTVSFLDTRTALRLLFDMRYRSVLGNRILLPASRGLAHVARWDINGPLKAMFEPERFTDALLTFMSRRKIVLVGASQQRLDTALLRLTRHAPWHDYSVVHAADIGNRIAVNGSGSEHAKDAPDLVIVDAHGFREENRFERALSLRHNGLVVMAGRAFD